MVVFMIDYSLDDVRKLDRYRRAKVAMRQMLVEAEMDGPGLLANLLCEMAGVGLTFGYRQTLGNLYSRAVDRGSWRRQRRARPSFIETPSGKPDAEDAPD
jgi:hypothetical protein